MGNPPPLLAQPDKHHGKPDAQKSFLLHYLDMLFFEDSIRKVIDAPELWPEYCELIKSHDPELYKRLVVVETPGGGKHLPYRCEEIEANQKLAMRAVEVPKGTAGAKREDDIWIKLEALFETCGEGKLIVAPGGPLCVHPSGKSVTVSYNSCRASSRWRCGTKKSGRILAPRSSSSKVRFDFTDHRFDCSQHRNAARRDSTPQKTRRGFSPWPHSRHADQD